MSVRLDIDIRVKIPEYTKVEARMKFIQDTLALFRESFPSTEPIIQPGAPSPVTVTFHEEELEEVKWEPSDIHIPTHDEILKGLEEDIENDESN